MKKKLLLALLTLALLVGALLYAVFAYEPNGINSREAMSSAIIVLSEEGFMPREVVLKKGGAVTFSTTVNRPFWPASNLHPTHEIYSEFDPKRPLESGEQWSFTFDRVGSHNFHDHIRSYFVGTIHVVEQ